MFPPWLGHIPPASDHEEPGILVGRRDRVARQTRQALQDRAMKTAWVYINTAKEVGDLDYLKVFANEEAAEEWFAEHDPEAVAFEYSVIGADEE
jgi:hypothetical protein